MIEYPRILLVDDDRQVVRFFQKALEADGCAVTATTSGKDALEAIQASRPDLFIVDLNMPSPDGFELLKTVRTQHPYLRVLAISGFLDGALLEAATCLGAFATLPKPVAADTLVTKVREVLGSGKGTE